MSQPQIVPGAGVALLGGALNPQHRLAFIVVHALSAGEHDAQIELGQGMVRSAALRYQRAASA